MQGQKRNPYEGSFYNKHRLYQFLGILRTSSEDDIRDMLDKEHDVLSAMMRRNIQQNKDVKVRINHIIDELGREETSMLEMIERQDKDIMNLKNLFGRARIVFSNRACKHSYDEWGDPADLPQLPPVHQKYYAPPLDIPPDYLVQIPKVAYIPPPPKEPHPDVRVQRKRRSKPLLQERSEDTIIAQPSR